MDKTCFGSLGTTLTILIVLQVCYVNGNRPESYSRKIKSGGKGGFYSSKFGDLYEARDFVLETTTAPPVLEYLQKTVGIPRSYHQNNDQIHPDAEFPNIEDRWLTTSLPLTTYTNEDYRRGGVKGERKGIRLTTEMHEFTTFPSDPITEEYRRIKGGVKGGVKGRKGHLVTTTGFPEYTTAGVEPEGQDYRSVKGRKGHVVTTTGFLDYTTPKFDSEGEDYRSIKGGTKGGRKGHLITTTAFPEYTTVNLDSEAEDYKSEGIKGRKGLKITTDGPVGTTVADDYRSIKGGTKGWTRKGSNSYTTDQEFGATFAPTTLEPTTFSYHRNVGDLPRVTVYPNASPATNTYSPDVVIPARSSRPTTTENLEVTTADYYQPNILNLPSFSSSHSTETPLLTTVLEYRQETESPYDQKTIHPGFQTTQRPIYPTTTESDFGQETQRPSGQETIGPDDFQTQVVQTTQTPIDSQSTEFPDVQLTQRPHDGQSTVFPDIQSSQHPDDGQSTIFPDIQSTQKPEEGQTTVFPHFQSTQRPTTFPSDSQNTQSPLEPDDSQQATTEPSYQTLEPEVSTQGHVQEPTTHSWRQETEEPSWQQTESPQMTQHPDEPIYPTTTQVPTTLPSFKSSKGHTYPLGVGGRHHIKGGKGGKGKGSSGDGFQRYPLGNPVGAGKGVKKETSTPKVSVFNRGGSGLRPKHALTESPFIDSSTPLLPSIRGLENALSILSYEAK